MVSGAVGLMMGMGVALSALISLLLLWLVDRRMIPWLPMDRPNERSLHIKPVPRSGGIAIMAGLAAAIPLFPDVVRIAALLALALAVFSFVDDVRGLPVWLRFMVQVAAALLFASCLALPAQPWILFGLLIVAMVWMTNLYNFMDGMDGFAGGMSVAGFGSYAVAAGWAHSPALACISAAIATSSLMFLRFNFPPARLFMGDVGSIPLGFLAASLGVLGWSQSVWPLWFPVLVFAPFIVDATATLLRRALRREPVWRAHREHYYQRLVRMGWSHRRTVLVEYTLMLTGIAVALMSLRQSTKVQAAMALGLAIVYALLMVAVDRRWRRSATR